MAAKITIGELIAKLRLDSSGFERGAASARSRISGITSGLKSASLQVAAFAAALGVAGFALKKFIDRGGQVTNVQRAFQRVTGDATGAVRQLRSATQGLVADYDLMVGFNRAVALGSARNAQEFSDLARTALTLGRALGVDATFALESLSLGIGRQSRLILDNLGLIVSVEEANKKYAAALGKTAAQLTQAEQKEAFRTAAMEAARAKIKELGGVTLTAADRVRQFQVHVANLRDELAVKFLPILGRVIEGMTLFLNPLREFKEQVKGFSTQFLEKRLQVTGTELANVTKATKAAQVGTKEWFDLMASKRELLGEFNALIEELAFRARRVGNAAKNAAQPLEDLADAVKQAVEAGDPLVMADPFRSATQFGGGAFAFGQAAEITRGVGQASVAPIRDAIEGPLAKSLKEAGLTGARALISGLIRGVKDFKDFLKNVLLSILETAILGVFSKLFKIGSPSKVTMGIGRDIMAGLTLGIQSQLGVLADVSQRMAAVPAMAMAGAGPAINISADFSKLPAPLTPGEAALNRAWQDLFRETLQALRFQGAR